MKTYNKLSGARIASHHYNQLTIALPEQRATLLPAYGLQRAEDPFFGGLEDEAKCLELNFELCGIVTQLDGDLPYLGYRSAPEIYEYFSRYHPEPHHIAVGIKLFGREDELFDVIPFHAALNNENRITIDDKELFIWQRADGYKIGFPLDLFLKAYQRLVEFLAEMKLHTYQLNDRAYQCVGPFVTDQLKGKSRRYNGRGELIGFPATPASYRSDLSCVYLGPKGYFKDDDRMQNLYGFSVELPPPIESTIAPSGNADTGIAFTPVCKAHPYQTALPILIAAWE